MLTGTGTNTQSGETGPVTGTVSGLSATVVIQGVGAYATYSLTLAADGNTFAGSATVTGYSSGATKPLATVAGTQGEHTALTIALSTNLPRAVSGCGSRPRSPFRRPRSEAR